MSSKESNKYSTLYRCRGIEQNVKTYEEPKKYIEMETDEYKEDMEIEGVTECEMDFSSSYSNGNSSLMEPGLDMICSNISLAQLAKITSEE